MNGKLIPILDQEFNALLEGPVPSTRRSARKKVSPPDYQGSILDKTGVLTQEIPPAVQNKAVFWDWIQYSGLIGSKGLNEVPGVFKLKERETGTQGFKRAFDIYTLTNTGVTDQGDEWDKCALLETEPRVSYIDPTICLIKLENKYCYQAGVNMFIELLNEHLQIQFKNYVRIDCAMDFQSINYKGSPQKFMNDCAAELNRMKGKTMTTHHDTTGVTGIQWGRRSSGASVTMYNKTLEMRKPGKHKPWIAELWHKAQFITGVNVYRLEFSVKKNLYDLIDETTGETLGNHTDVNFIADIDRYINWAYNRHFRIAINEPGVKFDRLEQLNILNMKSGFIKAERLSEKTKSTNYIKCQIKNTIQDAVTYQDNGDKLMSSVLFDYATQLVDKYYLNEWYNKKFAYLIVEKQNTTLDTLIDEQAEHLKQLHKSVRQNFYRMNTN